jgi:AraC-like DNA-binding protein
MDAYDLLREPMDMPNPLFPIKVHTCRSDGIGTLLFPAHWHAHVEILCIMDGEADITCGAETLRAVSGDVVVVNSNELHYGISRSERLFYYAVIFDLALLDSRSIDDIQTKYITPIARNMLLFRNLIEHDESPRACMLALIDELEQQAYGYELAVKSRLYAFLYLLLRSHVATILTPEDSASRVSILERLAPALTVIEHQYRDKLTVDRLARETGLSRYHFSRLFKKLTGRTITDYLNRIRIDHAEYLLYNSPMTVSEIALATGYSDIYYFSRTFKRYKGAPPTALRRLD